ELVASVRGGGGARGAGGCVAGWGGRRPGGPEEVGRGARRAEGRAAGRVRRLVRGLRRAPEPGRDYHQGLTGSAERGVRNAECGTRSAERNPEPGRSTRERRLRHGSFC